jgi:hypothetical protein
MTSHATKAKSAEVGRATAPLLIEAFGQRWEELTERRTWSGDTAVRHRMCEPA